MKKSHYKLSLALLALVTCATVPSALSNSIFYVNGLAVDQLEGEPEFDKPLYDGGLPRLQDTSSAIPMNAEPRLAIPEPKPMPRQQGGVVPQVAPPSEAQQHIKASEVYMRSGQWAEALHELELAIRADNSKVGLAGRAAVAAALAKQYDKSNFYFEQYVQQNPKSVAHLAGWAGVLLRLGRLAESEAHSQRALSMNPKDLVARFNILAVQMARKEYATARGAWEHLTTLELESVASWLEVDAPELIEVLGEEGFARLCAIAVGEGTDEHISEIVTSLRGALRHMERQNWSDAVAELRQVLKFGVRGSGFEMEVARVLFEMGQVDKAMKLFDHLSKKYGDQIEVLFNYGYAALKSGHADRAVTAFEKAHELAPMAGQVTFALACSYASRGNMDMAWDLIAQIAKSHKQQLPTWFEGDAAYLVALRSDARYAEFVPGGSP